MTWLIVFLVSLPLSLFLLWVFYLAVMNLKRAKDAGELKGMALYAGLVALALGYALDFYVNVVVMSLLLVEVPHEGTVTYRLKRHNERTYKWYEAVPWSKAVVRWFQPLLDPFDPSGKHI